VHNQAYGVGKLGAGDGDCVIAAQTGSTDSATPVTRAGVEEKLQCP